jgi:hypothetical protein
MYTYIIQDMTSFSRLPSASFSLHANDRFRYHENVCTPGYTYAFWKWEQWEEHIDWMALNGINIPLAFTAQESVWSTVYQQVHTTCSAAITKRSQHYEVCLLLVQCEPVRLGLPLCRPSLPPLGPHG